MSMTMADVHREEGREEGWLKGRRETLIEVLEGKFGALSPKALASIRVADQGQLSQWIHRVGTSASLAEVGIEA